MPTIIEIQHAALQQALHQLSDRIQNPRGFYGGIGEDMMERTKQRFTSMTAPDGTKWQPNSAATIANYIKEKGKKYAQTTKNRSKSNFITKRILQGLGGSLAAQFHWDATADAVTLGSTMKYAAMQQYGGTKAQFPQLWGNIPARPFLPVTPSNDMYPEEVELILESLREYLES